MFKKTYTDVVNPDQQLTVDSRATLPVRFQLSDGCEKLIAFLGYTDVSALRLQLGEWVERWLNQRVEK